MPRPVKRRNVCSLPDTNKFGPSEQKADPDNAVLMTVDEYETIRLIDLEGFTQEECAQQMQVARTTVQGMYSIARKKLADALVNAKQLIISGGKYRLCPGNTKGCGRACRRRGHGKAQCKKGK